MDRHCENIAPVILVEVRMFDPTIGVATRWRKGKSGNPGGRPRSRTISEALREKLAEIEQPLATVPVFVERSPPDVDIHSGV